MGIGGNYSYNHVGNTQTSNRFHVNLNYAFRFNHSSLRIGIAPGIQRLRMDYPAWITTSPQPDPAFPQSGAQTKFSFNSGVAWTNDKLSLNFGVCQLTNPYFDKVKFHSAPEYFLGLTYSTALPNGSTLNPSFHMEKNGPSSQIQTALFFHHQKGPQLGGFWRRQDSSGVIIGFQKKNPFLFQYVFEKPLSFPICIRNSNRFICTIPKIFSRITYCLSTQERDIVIIVAFYFHSLQTQTLRKPTQACTVFTSMRSPFFRSSCK